MLTSRTQPYRDAVHPLNDAEVLLAGAAGIQLCPLDADAITDYLGDPPPGSATRHRWQPVLATLTTQPPPAVAQALTTPLMVGLAKTIYNPRPGEHTGALPNPAELLDLGCFPDRTTVEQHLFDGFIPAAYRPHPDPKRTSRWSAPQAESWLVFLAHHLEDRLHTTDLRWWEISRAIPEWFLKLTTGLTAGLGYGLTTRLAVELAGGLGFGLVFGLASGVIYGFLSESTADPAQGVRWSPDAGVKAGLKAGLGYGLAAGLRVGLTVGLMTMTGWGVIGGEGHGHHSRSPGGGWRYEVGCRGR